MSLETTVQSLVDSTTSLLVAVNTRKTDLDTATITAASSAAIATAKASEASSFATSAAEYAAQAASSANTAVSGGIRYDTAQSLSATEKLQARNNISLAAVAASGAYADLTGRPTALSAFTNDPGFITSAALTPYLTSASAATTYQPIGAYLTGINSGQVTAALGFTPANKAGDTFTGAVLTSNAGGFTANSAAKLWTDSSRGRLDLYEGATQTKSLRVFNANGYGIVGMTSAENLELWTNGVARITINGSTGASTFAANATINSGADSRVLLQSSGVTQGQFQTTASAVRLASNNTLPLYLSQNGVDLLDVTTTAIVGNRQFRVPNSAAYLYAFVGEQTAGAGKYNLYMSGTAANYLAGALQVDGGITGDLTGNVTGNVSGTAATITGVYGGTLTSGQVTTALGFTPYDATNPSGYIASSALTPYLTTATAASTYQPIGAYLTGIDSSHVTTALGFTPYSAANPAGYTSNVGDVTLTGTQTLTNKTLTSPTINTGTASGLTLNDGYTEEVFAVSGATPALSPTNGSIQTWTLTANSTPTAGTWAEGQSITLMVDDGTAYTITWTSLAVTWETGGGTAPTLATTGYTVITLWKVGTTIYGATVGG